MPNWSLMNVGFGPLDARIKAEWRDLAERSLVPAGPHGPELMMAGLSLDPATMVATVRDADGLQLVLPLKRRWFPRPMLATLATPVTMDCPPLLGQAAAEPALGALLRHGPGPILLRGLAEDGPLWRAVANASCHMAVIERWERAILEPRGSHADWLETTFERKRRKEYRRLQARLSEQGHLAALDFAAGDDIATWTDEFLKLEAAGWKGRRGTAISADPASVHALHEGLKGLAHGGRLRFWKLALEGRPVAMLFGIVERGEGWLFKIAYDESLARFSPGVLLVLHATARLFGENLTRVDSCAIPDHPMIDKIWRGRMKVADVLIAGPQMGAASFATTAATLRLSARARGRMRDIYNRLRSRRRS